MVTNGAFMQETHTLSKELNWFISHMIGERKAQVLTNTQPIRNKVYRSAREHVSGQTTNSNTKGSKN
jgi:hypothetical protein